MIFLNVDDIRNDSEIKYSMTTIIFFLISDGTENEDLIPDIHCIASISCIYPLINVG